MVYAAKRDPNRCPTHPGALLRDEMIPATGRGKARCQSYRNFAPAPLRHLESARARFRQPLQFGLASSLATARGFELECKPRMTRGMRNARENVSAIPTIKTRAA